MENKEIKEEKLNLSISRDEFEAVLNVCKNMFKRVEEYTQQREKFLKSHSSKMNYAEEHFKGQVPDEEFEQKMKAIKRIADVVDKKGTRILRNMVGTNKDIYHMIEFLKRFGEVGEYEDIDLSFLNKKD